MEAHPAPAGAAHDGTSWRSSEGRHLPRAHGAESRSSGRLPERQRGASQPHWVRADRRKLLRVAQGVDGAKALSMMDAEREVRWMGMRVLPASFFLAILALVTSAG